jgi:hypothetical protein
MKAGNPLIVGEPHIKWTDDESSLFKILK